MIQRIQSVFLLAALGFMAPMFFVPTAEIFLETGELLVFNFKGFYIDETLVSAQYSIMLFAILICALNLIVLFMYKNRITQMRLCIYNILLLIGITGIAFFTLYNVHGILTVSFRMPIVFPVISAIFHYLAFRGIRKDHFMVEALTRLR